MTQSVELEIGGMTCSSCAARIEKRLNRLPGVQATVNFATEKAKVTLPEGVSITEAVAAVEATGYTAREHVREPAREPDRDSEPEAYPELAALRTRLLAMVLVPLGGLTVMAVSTTRTRAETADHTVEIDRAVGRVSRLMRARAALFGERMFTETITALQADGQVSLGQASEIAEIDLEHGQARYRDELDRAVAALGEGRFEIDLPLVNIAGGEWMLAIDADAGSDRAGVMLPFRINQ